jgi:hypothetical protein
MTNRNDNRNTAARPKTAAKHTPQSARGAAPKRGRTYLKGAELKKKQSKQFAVFFVTVMFIGAIVCVVAFAMVFKSFSDNAVVSDNAPLPTIAAITAPPNPEDLKTATLTAIVQKNYADSLRLQLYDYLSGGELTVFCDESSEMKDKYGNKMSFSEFPSGSVVDVTYTPSTGRVKLIRASVNSWKYTGISGVIVDTGASAISFGSSGFIFDQNTLAFYKGGDFNLAYVDAIDVVNIEGYKDYVSSLEVVKSHGTLEIAAMIDIVGGVAEIDASVIVELSANVSQKIAEGSHSVVIKGTNIEPFITDFSIARNETYTLGAVDLTYTGGAVIVNCTEPGVRLTINGEEKPLNEPIQMSYGEIDMRVSKDGYTSWEDTFTFNEPKLELSVTLDKIQTTAQLLISTNPPGADIYIDGVYYGQSPVNVSLDYGQRMISFRKDGYRDVDFPILLNENNSPPSLTLTMEIAPEW